MKPALPIPRIRVNAEFQRLLWLNASPGLIIGVVLVYLLFLQLGDRSKWTETASILGLNGTALSLLAMFVLLGRSFRQDVSSNMLDQMRMSALSPWQMTYSRLIAAPIVAWVGCLIGIVLFSVPWLSDGYSVPVVLIWAANALLGCWIFACAVFINNLQFGRGARQWSGSLLQLILLGIIVQAFSFGMSEWIGLPAAAAWLKTADSESSSGATLLYLLTSNLMLAIAASFCARAATENKLHLRPGGLCWLGTALLLPLMFWWMVFDPNRAALMTALIYGSAAIISMLAQDSRSAVFRDAMTHLAKGRIRNAFDILPAWVVLLPLGTIAAAVAPHEGHNSLPVSNYIQLYGLLCCVLAMSNFKLRYNSITLAMVLYLVVRLFVAVSGL